MADNTNSPTVIFDSRGRINPDIDPQMIAPDRRAQFIALAAAQIVTEQAEADETAANAAVVEAVRVFDIANAALPRSTFLEEHRRAAADYARRH